MTSEVNSNFNAFAMQTYTPAAPLLEQIYGPEQTLSKKVNSFVFELIRAAYLLIATVTGGLLIGLDYLVIFCINKHRSEAASSSIAFSSSNYIELTEIPPRQRPDADSNDPQLPSDTDSTDSQSSSDSELEDNNKPFVQMTKSITVFQTKNETPKSNSKLNMKSTAFSNVQVPSEITSNNEQTFPTSDSEIQQIDTKTLPSLSNQSRPPGFTAFFEDGSKETLDSFFISSTTSLHETTTPSSTQSKTPDSTVAGSSSRERLNLNIKPPLKDPTPIPTLHVWNQSPQLPQGSTANSQAKTTAAQLAKTMLNKNALDRPLQRLTGQATASRNNMNKNLTSPTHNRNKVFTADQIRDMWAKKMDELARQRPQAKNSNEFQVISTSTQSNSRAPQYAELCSLLSAFLNSQWNSARSFTFPPTPSHVSTPSTQNLHDGTKRQPTFMTHLQAMFIKMGQRKASEQQETSADLATTHQIVDITYQSISDQRQSALGLAAIFFNNPEVADGNDNQAISLEEWLRRANEYLKNNQSEAQEPLWSQSPNPGDPQIEVIET
ncbi:MAG: hypothetical protein S4CHLAM20_03280 [Chlamydiia bacterium]|nr:hypothetical protein [Chlamydiia bacterium]